MKAKKPIIFAAITVSLLAAAFVVLFGNPVILKNNRDFGRSVRALNVDSVTLNELTSFEWDAVYTFPLYMPRQQMEEIIGFRSRYIQQTYSESAMQLIFVRGNRVVCAVIGFPDGYMVFFSTASGKNYSKIRYSDNAVFSVEHRDVWIVATNTYIPMVILSHTE